MNCQDFAAITRDYARECSHEEGIEKCISASAREQARRHLAACEPCRRRLEDDAALSAALAMAAKESRTLEAPQAAESAVLEAFRKTRRPPGMPLRPGLWWAAAVAVLCLAAFLWPRNRHPQAALPEVASRRAPVQEAVQPAVPPAPETRVQPASPEPGTIPRSRPLARPEENVTQFIPLRYGKPVESGETLQVVRITLRRADLLRLGLPVAPDGGSGLVKADVLLGEDGLTKAIRFVY
ncbi:MAG: hypothetical protein IT165_07990 [Bryobacterales bacterium]|nr:hypothetical protein [Bryobacterales bacterium]